MHGIIFTSFRDYLSFRESSALASDVFAGTLHSMSESYPDEEFARVLRRARERLDVPEAELLEAFGRFTGERVFPRLYPPFYTVAGGTLPFLLAIENRIHELVRATIPSARPPQLGVAPLESGVEIRYSSRRRLCRLLEGLVIGTADHYEEEVSVEEVACMNEGAKACVFQARLSA